jgi:F0F1-type ATP synthase membrane subunit b/b'
MLFLLDGRVRPWRDCGGVFKNRSTDIQDTVDKTAQGHDDVVAVLKEYTACGGRK